MQPKLTIIILISHIITKFNYKLSDNTLKETI